MNLIRIISKSTLLLFLVALFGCNITKNVPEGEYLLTKNTYKYKKIQFGSSEAKLYTKQKANSKSLFVFPFGLFLYNIIPQHLTPVLKEYNNLSKKKKNQKSLDSLYVKNNLNNHIGKKHWFFKICYKYGEKPIVLDSILINSSAKNIEQFYMNKGFFNAKVTPSYKKQKKKAKVIYRISLGKSYKIDDFLYSIEDSVQRNIYEKQIIENSLIKKGERYDLFNITKEKERIVDVFKNNGYYDFETEANQINFYADSTTTKSKKINLLLKITPKEKKDTLHIKDKQFTYQTIHIHTQKDSKDEVNDTLYKGYQIHTKDNTYKLKTFTNPLVIKKGGFFSENDIANTKRNIIALDNFTVERVEIKKNEKNDSTLIANIKILRKKKNEIELFLESSYSDLFSIGLSPGIAYTKRNIFRGGENIKFSLKGTMGTVASNNKNENEIFNAYQIYAQSKLVFPYFVFPIFNKEGSLFKSAIPKTYINLGTSFQKNIGLDRIDFSGSLEYVLTPNAHTKHIITPFGVKVVKNIGASKYFNIFSSDSGIYTELTNSFYNYNLLVSGNSTLYEEILSARKYTSEEIIKELIYNQSGFINSLSQAEIKKYRNLLFRYQRITQDVMLNFFSYEYLYNGYENKYTKHPFYFSGRIETGGNFLGLIDNTFKISKPNSNGWKTILDVPYSQYIKIDLDFRKKWNLSTNQQIIFRNFLGISVPYGNLNFNSFEKTYFSGGSNDVRAWRAYSLGVADQGTNYGDFAIGDLKLTLNLEYRYKIAKKINGAFFIDAGNIWTINHGDAAAFKFNNFYKQLGIGPGTGFRYDLSYLILRFDWAYKLHDPSLQEGLKWNVSESALGLYNTTLNFSINYPF